MSELPRKKIILLGKEFGVIEAHLKANNSYVLEYSEINKIEEVQLSAFEGDLILVDGALLDHYDDTANTSAWKGSRNCPIAVVYEDDFPLYQKALSMGADGFLFVNELDEKELEKELGLIIGLKKGNVGLPLADHFFFTDSTNLSERMQLWIKNLTETQTQLSLLLGARGVGKQHLLRQIFKQEQTTDTFEWEDLSWEKVEDSEKQILIFYGVSKTVQGEVERLKQYLEIGKKIVLVSERSVEELGLTSASSLEIKPDNILHIPRLQDRPGDILLFVDFLLKHSRITFQYLNFFNNKADNIFSLQARSLLLLYPWNSNVRELRTLLQRAVFEAHRLKIELINEDCLPDRIKDHALDVLSALKLRPKTMQSARFELIEIERKLKIFKSISEAHLSLGNNEIKAFKEKIREIRLGFPDLIDHSYTKIRTFFKLNVLLVYATEQEKLYLELHKFLLKNNEQVSYFTNHPEPSEDINAGLNYRIEAADLCIKLLCKDLISNEKKYGYTLNKVNQRVKEKNLAFFPIIAGHVNLDGTPYKDLGVFYQNKAPLSAFQGSALDEQLLENAKEINKFIESLRII